MPAGISAEAQEALERLAAENDGRLTPDLVVQTARDEESPLHTYFEWDRDLAAESWWREQARALIRRASFVVEHQDGTYTRIPTFVRDPDVEPRVQGYVRVEDLARVQRSARAALRWELGRVQAGLDRAYRLAEGVGLSEEVDELVRRVVRIRQTVEAHG